MYEVASYWKNRIIVDGEGVSVNVNIETPGTLGEKLLEQVEYLRNVNYLTVSGTLNDADMESIKTRMTGLLTIDMSNVSLTWLPDNLFDERYALQKVVLPNNLQGIGNYAFRDCYALQDVVLPSSLKSIGYYAFEDCDNMHDVVIPEGVTSIGEGAYSGCDSLQNVQWPSTVATIRNSTFYTSGLRKIYIPEGVTKIESSSFYNTNLKVLECPSTLKSIGAGAFCDCDSLMNIELNEGLEYLYGNSFDNCDALTNIILPSTLIYCNIPFSECDNIREVTCKALIPPTLAYDYDILYYVNKENSVLYVPEWTINKYKLTAGWDDFLWIEPIKGNWPENIQVRENVSLTVPDTIPAAYKPNVSLLYDNDYGYGSLHLTGNAMFSVGTFSMETSNSYQDYKYGFSSLLTETDMRADSVVVCLSTRNDQWRFLSFPYDVKVSEIIPEYGNTNFVIRKYSGKERAEANFDNTWQNMTIDSVLHAGEGYILQSSRYESDGDYAYWSGFYFPAINNTNKNLIFVKEDRQVALNEYQSEFSHNRSWNLIGNPYPCYYDTRAMNFTAPITVWDPFNSTYYAYSPIDDAYILSPTEAFFVQRPVDTEAITFAAEGRQTNRVVRAQLVRTKTYACGENNRQIFNLVLANGEKFDRTRFVINSDASTDYDMSNDATKFMSSDALVSQVYTMEGDVKYAINERPIGNGVILLGAYFGEKGSYTIALDTKHENAYVVLVDKVTGVETDLMNDTYTFTTDAGIVENRFKIRVSVGDDNKATGIETLNGHTSVTSDGGEIIVVTPIETEITVYNAKGQCVATTTAASASFDVPSGVYMVKVQNVTHKISVSR